VRSLVLALVFVFASALPGPAQSRPNLLLLTIDTLRADHVGCYGYDRPTTPSIDLVAANGTRFAQARTVAPWTLPSFASMFTGRYPTRHGAGAEGALRNVGNEPPRVLAANVPTLGEVLRGAGYRTHAVTSNPYLKLGPLRGFDPYVCKAVRADRIGALSREWLARETTQGGPWALWVHFNDPHEPTIAADAYLRQVGYGELVIDDPHRRDLERWGSREKGTHLGHIGDAERAGDLLATKIALYDATIRHVDTEIGRILESLQRSGALQNTLVVVLSDHGEEFLDHVALQERWRHDPRGVTGIGHGHTLFDEQLRVPLILMGPGVTPDRVIEQQFPLIDLMPTLLAMLQVHAPQGMDGADRRGWIEDRQRQPIPMAAESTAYGPDWVAWIDGRFKLVTDRVGTPLLLFDLHADPFELHDRVAELDSLPEATFLRDALMGWNDAVLADAPPPTALGELTDDMLEGLRSLGYVQ
jgi:arylsulfatase A-like enzyme